MSVAKMKPLYLNNKTANHLDFLAFKSPIWALSKYEVKV